jgi:hypothetical protein
MKYLLPLLLLFLLIFTAGCVSLPGIFGATQQIGGGLFVTMRPDPQTVFAGGDVRVDIDVDNHNPRSISDVFINLFDPGYLQLKGRLDGSTIVPADATNSLCNRYLPAMRPGSFASLTCALGARGIQQDYLETTASASVAYTTDLSFLQIIDIMSEDEYTRRLEQGQLVTKPKSYSYQDKNVRIDVEFSESLPMVVRNRQYYMYITVNNIGNGFINDIHAGQLLAAPAGVQATVDGILQTLPQGIVNCADLDDPNWSIHPSGNTFPRIACEVKMPEGVRVIENYGLLVTLSYNYEVRGSAEVRILR